MFGKHEEIIPEDGFGLIKLDENYRQKMPQSGGTEVRVAIHVKGLTEIDVDKKTVGLQIRLSMEWEDRRVDTLFDCGESAAFKTSVIRC